jgi:hypothetical protein
MMSVTRKCCFLFLVVLVFVFPATAGSSAANDEYFLSVPALEHDPGERIMAFHFKIFGGEIAGFPRVPRGWTINISNGPGSWSYVSGKAIHGGEFVPPEEFVKMVVFVTKMPEDMRELSGAPRSMEVTGYVDMYNYVKVNNIETTRRSNLSNTDFMMSPR